MSQLASDPFTGTGADLGANWTAHTLFSGWQRASDEAEALASGANVDLYTALAAPNDCYASIVIGTVRETTADSGVGPGVRWNAATQDGYFSQSNSTDTRLYKVTNAGGFVQLGATGAAAAVSDVIELQASGTTITLKRNGTAICGTPLTDSSIASGRAAMWGYNAGVACKVASWEFGSLAAAGGTLLLRNEGGLNGGMRAMSGGMRG